MAELHGRASLFGVPLFGVDPLPLPLGGVCNSRFNASLLACCQCLQHFTPSREEDHALRIVLGFSCFQGHIEEGRAMCVHVVWI